MSHVTRFIHLLGVLESPQSTKLTGQPASYHRPKCIRVKSIIPWEWLWKEEVQLTCAQRWKTHGSETGSGSQRLLQPLHSCTSSMCNRNMQVCMSFQNVSILTAQRNMRKTRHHCIIHWILTIIIDHYVTYAQSSALPTFWFKKLINGFCPSTCCMTHPKMGSSPQKKKATPLISGWLWECNGIDLPNCLLQSLPNMARVQILIAISTLVAHPAASLMLDLCLHTFVPSMLSSGCCWHRQSSHPLSSA